MNRQPEWDVICNYKGFWMLFRNANNVSTVNPSKFGLICILFWSFFRLPVNLLNKWGASRYIQIGIWINNSKFLQVSWNSRKYFYLLKKLNKIFSKCSKDELVNYRSASFKRPVYWTFFHHGLVAPIDPKIVRFCIGLIDYKTGLMYL